MKGEIFGIWEAEEFPSRLCVAAPGRVIPPRTLLDLQSQPCQQILERCDCDTGPLFMQPPYKGPPWAVGGPLFFGLCGFLFRHGLNKDTRTLLGRKRTLGGYFWFVSICGCVHPVYWKNCFDCVSGCIVCRCTCVFFCVWIFNPPPCPYLCGCASCSRPVCANEYPFLCVVVCLCQYFFLACIIPFFQGITAIFWLRASKRARKRLVLGCTFVSLSLRAVCADLVKIDLVYQQGCFVFFFIPIMSHYLSLNIFPITVNRLPNVFAHLLGETTDHLKDSFARFGATDIYSFF